MWWQVHADLSVCDLGHRAVARAARCADVRILRGVPFQRHHDTRVLPGRQIVRSDLLHGGLGVTDPVSGPVVLALN